MIRTLALVVGLALVGLTLAAQPAAPTEGQVRQWAAAAAREASRGMNPTTRRTAYVRNFHKLVKSALRDYDSSDVTVYDTAWKGGVTIQLAGPVAHFERESAAAFGRGNSPASVGWMAGPAVFVAPRSVYPPDIVNVVVVSDGVEVAPLDATHYAAPSTAEWFEPSHSGRGSGMALRSAPVNVHGGVIVYPSSAFATGRSVTVTVIASAGWTHVKTLSAGDLRKLR